MVFCMFIIWVSDLCVCILMRISGVCSPRITMISTQTFL